MRTELWREPDDEPLTNEHTNDIQKGPGHLIWPHFPAIAEPVAPDLLLDDRTAVSSQTGRSRPSKANGSPR